MGGGKSDSLEKKTGIIFIPKEWILIFPLSNTEMSSVRKKIFKWDLQMSKHLTYNHYTQLSSKMHVHVSWCFEAMNVY